jgi:hypothetical protein
LGGLTVGEQLSAAEQAIVILIQLQILHTRANTQSEHDSF